MKILIVCDVYPPEISSAANLMQELGEGLKTAGHEVFVVTPYPRSYVSEAEQSEVFPEVRDENGIKVIRVKTLPLKKVNFILRGISTILLPRLLMKKIKKHLNEIDATIIYSPPLTLGLLGGAIKKRYKAKILLNIQDLFPQNAIDLGILKRSNPIHALAIPMFEWIEKKAYKLADVLTFHSDGGKKFLIERKRVPEKKISLLHNWIDMKQFDGNANARNFRKEWNLENKFLILFAGIMGPAQGMEFVTDVAREVKDLKDVAFLLVGDGMEKPKVEEAIKSNSLENVIIKPFISKEDYPSLVKNVDVGLVCLSPKNKTSFVPGKFLGYLAARKPVLAFLNKESDGFVLMNEAKCGIAVVSNDKEAAIKAVRSLYEKRNELDTWGKNGHAYAKAHLTLEACVNKIEDLLNGLDK